MSTAADHITEIERVVTGAGSLVRDHAVVASWQRCVEQYGLDPARPNPAYILPETQLRAHREQSERLVAMARSGLQTLFRQVAGENYVLLLADRQGVTVDFFGDPRFDAELRRAGLYLGADWSESRAGTCGVGACIHTGEALTIHQTDHFDLSHVPLSCTAGPIFDTSGALTAVLDISLLRSPSPKVSQRLALHLVTASTRRIELANLMACMRREWVLRLADDPDYLDIDPEAAVAVDGSGRILGMTHAAARLMARAAGVDWRRPDGLIGQSMETFFALTVDDLPGLTRGRPAEDRQIRLRDGSTLYAHAIAPAPPSIRSPASRAGTPVEALPAPLRELSGEDPAMRTLQRQAAKLARVEVPLFLRGETGVGKEWLARAIHRVRPGRGPFVPVNCAAIPEALIEGELFGHAPGAFTGALARGRRGLIEAADGGVLFLDEIGDMPLGLQSRLLRVLSEGEVLPLGGTRPRSVRLKVISASHHDLGALVRDGRFREDLFYRLAAATLVLPPLRDRTDFDWVLDRLTETHGTAPLTPEARLMLRRRRWPGNLRELANVLEVASALSDGDPITPDHLPAPALPEDSRTPGPDLAEALALCDGNVSRAARLLGVDRTTVHRRMRREGLSGPHS